jgi:putative transcriptional regulator
MNEELFEELVASVKEGGAILRGETPLSRRFTVDPLNVRDIRERLGLTQDAFARLMGISVRTLQNWEQGRRRPEGPAQVLLMVADKHPEALWDVVGPLVSD